MIRRIFTYIILFSFGIIFSGCFVWRITADNVWRTITTSPELVVNKIQNPVKDSVRLSALWAGHSTVLVQMYDKVIIVDPYFNNYFVGLFVRQIETGLAYKNLDKLDLIMVTHAHMDHLSFSSLDALEELHPKAHLIFPDGVEDYLPSYDFKMHKINTDKVFTSDYIGDSYYIEGIKITPVYAVHNGGRYAFDSYSWKVKGHSGFIVEYKDLSVYFAGDTGYDDTAFKKIGEKFDIELALIPIGPCRNCDSTGFSHHTSSLEALKLFDDIRADYMIPIHYGSIKYFSDPNQPMFVLRELIENTSYGDSKGYDEKIFILKEGEQLFFNEKD